MNRTTTRPIRTGTKRRIAAWILGLTATLLRIRAWLIRGRTPGTRDVLCLEPYGMGDVISLEPLVRALGRRGLRVHVCARAPWRPLLPPDQVASWLDARIPWTSYDPGRKYSGKAILGRGFRTFLRDLRRQGKGTIGLDTRGDVRNVILLYLAGCTRVHTLSHYLGSDMQVLRTAANIQPVDDRLERWRLNLEFLDAVDRSTREDRMAPPSLDHLGIDTGESDARRAVALVAASPWPGRLWARDRWRALARRLIDRGLSPVVLHGPGQKGYADDLAAGTGTDVVECATIEDWVRQLGAAAAVVSINTGPMHMAAALKRPLVVIDGPSRLPLWQPASSNSRLLHRQDALPCAPCHQINTEEDCGYRCMKSIDVEEVFNALLEVLALDPETGCDPAAISDMNRVNRVNRASQDGRAETARIRNRKPRRRRETASRP